MRSKREADPRSLIRETRIWINSINQLIEQQTRPLCEKYNIEMGSIKIALDNEPTMSRTQELIISTVNESMFRYLCSESGTETLSLRLAPYMLLLLSIALIPGALALSPLAFMPILRKYKIPRSLRKVVMNSDFAKSKMEYVCEKAKTVVEEELENQLVSDEQLGAMLGAIREHLNERADQAALVIRQRAG